MNKLNVQRAKGKTGKVGTKMSGVIWRVVVYLFIVALSGAVLYYSVTIG